MVRYNADNSVRNTKLTDDVTERRVLYGIKKNGQMIENIGSNPKDDKYKLDNYCGIIEQIGWADQELTRYFIKATNSGFFFSPYKNNFSSVQEWIWRKVEPTVMTLYTRFLETGSEKYLLMAQRRFQNGEQG